MSIQDQSRQAYIAALCRALTRISVRMLLVEYTFNGAKYMREASREDLLNLQLEVEKLYFYYFRYFRSGSIISVNRAIRT